MAEIINDQNFEEKVLQSSKTVLVDFFADWCGPCQMMAPIVEELAAEKPEIQVYKVNVDQSPDTARKYGIMSIPTFIVFKNGAPVKQELGAMSKDRLAALTD